MGAIALELLTGGWNLVKMGFTALGDFLKSLNAQGVVGLLVALVLSYFLYTQWSEARHWKKQSARYETLYTRDHTAFGRTVLNYRAAAAKAEAADRANSARVKAQQDLNSQEQSDDYEARLAAARAEYQRLRGASSGNLSGPSGAYLSSVSAPSSGSGAASGQDGLPLSDKYLCTAQSIQLDEIIKWANAQAAIDPNKP
jgi:hypothetical protein